MSGGSGNYSLQPGSSINFVSDATYNGQNGYTNVSAPQINFNPGSGIVSVTWVGTKAGPLPACDGSADCNAYTVALIFSFTIEDTTTSDTVGVSAVQVEVPVRAGDCAVS